MKSKLLCKAESIEIGSSFDVEQDFSGIEFSPEKVKVTFHEAKDKDGERFDIGKAGTYKAVYFVKPSGKHPSYHAMFHDRDLMEELGEKKNKMTIETETLYSAFQNVNHFKEC